MVSWNTESLNYAGNDGTCDLLGNAPLNSLKKLLNLSFETNITLHYILIKCYDFPPLPLVKEYL